MARGIYLIDPDGKTGMLDDGTEITLVPWSRFNGHDCGTCILDGKKGFDQGCMLAKCDSWTHPDEIKSFGVIFKARS